MSGRGLVNEIRETSRDLRFSAGGWGARTMMLVPAGTPVEVLCRMVSEDGSGKEVLGRLDGGELRTFSSDDLRSPKEEP